MLDRNFKQYAKLSPFELKDQLIERASSDAQQSKFFGDAAPLGFPELGRLRVA